MLGKNSFLGNILPAVAQAPAVRADGTDNGTGVQIAPGTGCGILVNVGTVADGTHDLTFEESDDGTTWNAVRRDDLDAYDEAGVDRLDAGADSSAAAMSLDTLGAGVFAVAYFGAKAHVRTPIETAGTTNGAPISVTILKDGERAVGRGPMTSSYGGSN